MTENDRASALRDLREFIEALDRRLPQIERVGEAAIAAEAARLRKMAVERIAELMAEQSASPSWRVRTSAADDAADLARMDHDEG
jgi:hypothetical protein